jgi:integrase
MIDVDRNIIELVHLRGDSRRLRRPLVLTPEQYQDLTWRLEEPHRTMVTVAMCTGLRASEILALRWEDINFESGVVLVQRGVVNGRIGQVKTEASTDDIPLAQEFSKILLDWKSKTPQKNAGLVFQSPVTGGCYYAGNHTARLSPSGGREDWTKRSWLAYLL